MEYDLCGRCARAYGKRESCGEKGCFVCRGAFAGFDSLLAEALAKSENFEFDRFAVSSALPKEVLVREEILIDQVGAGDAISVKNVLNAEIAERLSAATGKKFSQKEGEGVFTLDFLRGRGSFSPKPLFIFGRYLKFSREMPQSRWGCKKCGGKGCERCKGKGKMYLSFEDILGEAVREECGGCEGTKLHSAGREDIDARMLGEGRPFVLEVSGARRRKIDLGKIERRMNEREDIGVRGLMLADARAAEIITGARFDKEYSALVEIGARDLEKAAGEIMKLEGAEISQLTPERVLHRRSDRERRRRIKKLSVKIEDRLLRLNIVAEAGTYIKEFITGDGGRTKPSVSEAAGKARCVGLDVVGVRDRFLEDCV